MALIQCPECKKEISDKVKACPYCGYPMADETETIVSPDLQTTEQRPVTAAKSKTKKIAIISVGAVAALLIVVVAIFGYKAAADGAYMENIAYIYETIPSGAIEAAELSDLTRSVWSNSIWKDHDAETDKYTMTNGKFNSDFNTSLAAMFEDAEVQTKMDAIETSKSEVDAVMKKLQNPPKHLSEYYETVNSMYEAYLSLISLATSPTGNISYYSENIQTHASNFKKYHDKLKTQMPEN